MLTILHISDLHFGPHYRAEVGEALLQTASELGPDIIVISGDLTQRAKRRQFQDARTFLERLPGVPHVLVPGNHDVPLYRVVERMVHPLTLYRQHICNDLNHVLRLDKAVIVALNSTAPHTAITNGRLDKGQLEFCRQAFRDVPDGVARMVVTHHPFAPTPDRGLGETIRKGKRAMQCFRELDVEMVLGGHLHRAYVANSLDYFPGPTSERGILIVQCGTTTSGRGRGRERKRNSLNLIQMEPQQVRVTHYLHQTESGSFLPSSRHAFPRPGQRLAACGVREAAEQS